MANEILHQRRSIQTKRIENSAAEVFSSKPHHIMFMFPEEEISFLITDANGNILTESRRGTPISQIESMADEEITTRLARSRCAADAFACVVRAVGAMI
jgi:hypothetical protein